MFIRVTAVIDQFGLAMDVSPYNFLCTTLSALTCSAA
jgi:hypothetical protein